MFVIWKMTRRPVYLFYRDSCPHCIELKPEWSKFEIISLFSPIRTSRIDVANPDNSTFVEQYGINKIPTILKLGENGPVVYDGARDSNNICNWATTN